MLYFSLFYISAGFNREGFDREGYDWAGYNRYGFDRDGYDRDGFNVSGRDRDDKLDTSFVFEKQYLPQRQCLNRKGLYWLSKELSDKFEDSLELQF